MYTYVQAGTCALLLQRRAPTHATHPTLGSYKHERAGGGIRVALSVSPVIGIFAITTGDLFDFCVVFDAVHRLLPPSFAYE